jgi:hypothetical protein
MRHRKQRTAYTASHANVERNVGETGTPFNIKLTYHKWNRKLE